MSFRLINLSDPEKTIRMNNHAWYGILELAEDYGWQPMGTVMPEWLSGGQSSNDGSVEELGDYWSVNHRMVVLEDALNMGDALETAFVEYEPVHLRSLQALFESEVFANAHRHPPGIGVIKLLASFCHHGAFYIERLS